jgi:hypothetical protein
MIFSSFAIAISHMDTFLVWIVDPIWLYAFLRKTSNYVEIKEPKWIETK